MPKGYWNPQSSMTMRGVYNARMDKYHVKGTGDLVRDYLMTSGPDFMMNIWRWVKGQCDDNNYYAPSWETFRNYFYRLRRLQLVIPVDEDATMASSTGNAERMAITAYPRQIYRINPAMVMSPAWSNPLVEIDRLRAEEALASMLPRARRD